MRIDRKVWWAVTAGGLATAAVLVFPWARFAYEGRSGHLVLETADGVIGGVVAYLAFGRLRDSRRAADLALFGGLLLAASANLFLATAPGLGSGARFDQVGVWAPVMVRTVGSLVLAAAPLLHARLLAQPVQAGKRVLAAVATLTVVSALLVFVAAGSLPVAVDPTISPLHSANPLLTAHAAVFVLQSVMFMSFVVATFGYVRLSARTQDAFLTYVAAGLTLGTFARLHYLLFPSLYTNWVYSGDVLRLGFWLVLLAGAAREVRAYWQRLSDAAVSDERRRIARELHDGVAQELAYIVSQTISRHDNSDLVANRIGAAAERALHESRRAITLLGQSVDAPLTQLLSRAAEEVAQRHDVRVLQTGTGFEVTWQEREALVRIVREAVANAVRHGFARRVVLELEAAPKRILRVRDDGTGFVPGSEAAGGGYGLTSMTERAQALGGELRIRSTRGEGAVIEVELP